MSGKEKLEKIKKILLVKLDSVGDVVLIIPSLMAIRKKYPDAHISVLLKSYTADLLKDHPAVNEVIIDAYDKGEVKSFRDYVRYISDIRAKGFDAVVYFYSKSRYAFAGALAGIPIRIGDKGKLLYSWLFPQGMHQKWNDLTRHTAEHNLDLVKILTGDTPETDMLLCTGTKERERAAALLEDGGLQKDDFVIGIHLGTGGCNKPWRPEYYARVINELGKDLKLRLVITGGKHEEETAEKLLKELGQPVINLVGKTTLGELIGVTERYNLYMSVDTGPFHIAAALKIPTLMISPTKHVKPTCWGPWATRQIVVRKPIDCPLACMPWACRDERCLDQITVEEVLRAARELINGGGISDHKDKLRDWTVKSANLLVIGAENSEKDRAFIGALQKQGINTVYASQDNTNSDSIKTENIGRVRFGRDIFHQLVKLMVKHEVNIVHFTGNKVPWWFKLVTLWAAPSMHIPPLVIDTPISENPDNVDWLGFYIKNFRSL